MGNRAATVEIATKGSNAASKLSGALPFLSSRPVATETRLKVSGDKSQKYSSMMPSFGEFEKPQRCNFDNFNEKSETKSKMIVDSDGTAKLGIEPGMMGQRVCSVPAHVRATHGPDGATVLDILRGQMFRLNFVGSRILELLKQGLTDQEIADQLAREFGIERLAAEADRREFVQTLKKNHLLTGNDEGSLT
jgi:hypothetical protein